MFSWRISLLLATLVGAVTAALLAIIFQDKITQFRLRPSTPYQTYTPPPPPAYDARGAWALWPEDKSHGSADVFYVHSTTFHSRKHWNGPINDTASDETLRRVAIPNEAGPFIRMGATYGPRYRQATLFTKFTHKFDGLAARELAYRDVEKAFEHFIRERQSERPFILVGYGQGGLHVLGLLQYHIKNTRALRDQLAVAYIIGEPVSSENLPIAPCRDKKTTGCIVAYHDLEPGFDEEKRRLRKRSLTWGTDGKLSPLTRPTLLCVNPLDWRTTTALISPDQHKGAASATGLKLTETPPAITGALRAQCDNGILNVSSPRQAFLQRPHWFGSQWKPLHFNLFYYDLIEDAERRVENTLSRNVDLAPGSDDKIKTSPRMPPN